MKLALLTYDTNHLKTEQVALGLSERHQHDLTLIALPYVQRPARAIARPHRPDMSQGTTPDRLAHAIDAPLIKVPSADAIPLEGFDCYLITGAGLLPGQFVEATAGRVVNAHPGIIPLVRGLDAFKWAIHDDMPLGNSLHLIDADADAGDLLAVVQTPIFSDDSYETLARRHYEREIAMMIDFERYLTGPRPQPATPIRPARMRMKAETEVEMIANFAGYIARQAGSFATALSAGPLTKGTTD